MYNWYKQHQNDGKSDNENDNNQGMYTTDRHFLQ